MDFNSLFSHWDSADNATCLRNYNWDDKIVGMMKEVSHVHATFRAQGAKVVLSNCLLISYSLASKGPMYST